MSICRVRCPQHVGTPVDVTGCVLPRHHEGAHQCVTDAGRTFAWQFDWGCGCDDCRDNDWREWCIAGRVLPDERNGEAIDG